MNITVSITISDPPAPKRPRKKLTSLQRAEKAVDRPFTREASLALDREVLAAEKRKARR